jgi:hypothetical protein
VKFTATLPADQAKIPERLPEGRAVVNFLCGEGQLDAGNRILQILAD